MCELQLRIICFFYFLYPLVFPIIPLFSLVNVMLPPIERQQFFAIRPAYDLIILLFRSTVHTSKVNDYMPTPMQLDCFCEHCQALPDSPIHSYKLYAIIMHLGATMASGHYVAYTRVCSSVADYASCPRAKVFPSSSSPSSSRPSTERNSGNSNSGGGILRFFKPKSSTTLIADSVATSGSSVPLTLCKYAGLFWFGCLLPKHFVFQIVFISFLYF